MNNNRILELAPLVMGILSLICFGIFYYTLNYMDTSSAVPVIAGSLFSIAGVVISVVGRKNRREHMALWITGLLSSIVGASANIGFIAFLALIAWAILG